MAMNLLETLRILGLRMVSQIREKKSCSRWRV